MKSLLSAFLLAISLQPSAFSATRPLVIPALNVPQVSVTNLVVESLAVKSLAVKSVKVKSLVVPAWQPPVLPEGMLKFQGQAGVGVVLNEWRALIRAPRANLAPVPFEGSGLAAVAQLVTPCSGEEAANQDAELAFLKTLGFNGVLAVWHGEEPAWLAGRCRELRAAGWKVLFAFGPEESAGSEVYLRPSRIAQAAAAILPHADAALLTWRVTSAPHWGAFGTSEDGQAFVGCLAEIYRAAAPQLPLVDECYVKNSGLSRCSLPGASSTLLVNAGYQTFQPAVLSGYLKSHGVANPLLAMIVGPAPYYATVHPLRMSPAAIWQSKLQVRDRFQVAGFGTITLVGDGYGEREHRGTRFSDSLTRSQSRNANPGGTPNTFGVLPSTTQNK